MGKMIDAAEVGEIDSGEAKLVEADGKEIALFNVEGKYYAIDNECTHVGGPLCEGEIEGDRVICPWHGAEFDLKTGEAVEPPAEEDVSCYKVHVEGDLIKIEI